MRHRKAGIKLSRTASHRSAMFRNMVTSLFKHEQIRTTEAKAKELRRWADQLVTLAKRGDLHARRRAMAIIREKEVVHKLFAEAPKRYADVNGGYTRVVKIGFRPGDAAPLSLVQLVSPEPKKKKKPRRKKKAAPAAQPSQAAVTEAASGDAKPVPEATEPEATAKPDAPEAVAAGGAAETAAEEEEKAAEAQAKETPSTEDAPETAPEAPEAGESKEDK